MRKLEVEQQLKAMGVTPKYEAEFPLEDIQYVRSWQVRALDGGQAPKTEAKRYAALLDAGTEFPPVIITEHDKIIVDGNTRCAAFKLNRRNTIPAYLCNITSERVSRTISVALNAAHGKRMTRTELLDWVMGLNGSKVSDDEFIRYTGWTPRTYRYLLAQAAFKRRVEKLGIQLAYQVANANTQEALLKISLDEIFKEAVVLTSEAGLTREEIYEIVKAIEKAPTVREQQAIVDAARTTYLDRIQERKLGFKGATSGVNRQVNIHAGWIIKNAASGGLSDHNVHTRSLTQAKLEQVADAVRDVLQTEYGVVV